MRTALSLLTSILLLVSPTLLPAAAPATKPAAAVPKPPPAPLTAATAPAPDAAAIRAAVTDLIATFGPKYPSGQTYLDRLAKLEAELAAANKPGARSAVLAKLDELRTEALLANPLLDFDKLLLVKRTERSLGLPQNWQGNSSIAKNGYDNEVAVLSPVRPGGALATIFKPDGGKFVGDVDLHFDAGRMAFSMPDKAGRWQVFEADTDGKGLRQLTAGTDYDSYDPCYLPGGRIVFANTASIQGVPCVDGGDHVGLLYVMDADGRNVRQLTFDQDHSWNPTLLNSGRVMYTRWEYSDTPHYFTRILFQMNPDGTGQAELYGSNSYWPNSIFYARPIPGSASKVAGIVSGHHGTKRAGELIVFDPSAGQREADGAVKRIGAGPGAATRPVAPVIRDTLVDAVWPKYLHPFPLGEKHFLVAGQMNATARWGLYLVDAFDNVVLIRDEPGCALFEPVPFRRTAPPPAIPERVTPGATDATVYVADIYAGPGLKGVPRGAVKRLRVYSPYYAYWGMGGHTKVGIDGPWDVRRMLGTVPVREDGSAYFKVPANTPLAVQPLDAEGKALQVMRSWFTAMPGEAVSCIGCHERQSDAPPMRATLAQRTAPVEITPWHGPARGFSFKREVQGVVDRYCVSCHDGNAAARDHAAPDLRLTETRDFTPAYAALQPYVRRPGPESDYHMLPAGEYHADTSELVQMLKAGHHGVALDAEAWDRLVTWIDLNVPDRGTWSEEKKIPGKGHAQRQRYRKEFANLDIDPEVYPDTPAPLAAPVAPRAKPATPPTTMPAPAGWPFDAAEARRRQLAVGPTVERVIDLPGGLKLPMTLVPAGDFVMGDATVARIDRPFWVSKTEVPNAVFRLFDPGHDSGFVSAWGKDQNDRGYALNKDKQPAVRVSWDRATAFAQWLTQSTGQRFALPTEAQWEYACRAGAATPFSYGTADDDFAKFANLADISIKRFARGGTLHGGAWMLRDARFDDRQQVTANVGSYTANAWGLQDMHGNAAEWTRTADPNAPGRHIVRGGSWADRPHRATAAFRISYPQWQGVHNVGIRLVCEQ